MPDVNLPTVNQAVNPSIWHSMLEHVLLFLPQLFLSVLIFVVFLLVGMVTQGIVDRLVAPDRLLPEAIAFAATLAGGPRVAIGEIKLVAKQGLEMSLESALSLEREGIFRLFETADAKEGLAAFAEKRKPSWKGE